MKASFFVYRLVIRCSSVPIDMMRYDRAVPDTEEDSNKLFRIMRGHESADDHVVAFRVYSTLRRTAPDPRWASFNCEIVSFAPQG